MSIAARTALLAALAMVLPQLALLEGSDSAGVATDAATTAPPVQHAPHPTTADAHTILPGLVVDRLSSNPCRAAEALGLGHSTVEFRAPAIRRCPPLPSALVVLPPSRAPPALS